MTETYHPEVILIKLGGSVITNKAGFKQPDIPLIDQLVDEIHMILIDRLAATGEYPISLYASSFLTSRNHRRDRLFIDPMVNLLEHGLLPVTSGDTVTDSAIGFTIFSGEQVLNLLALALLKTNHKPRLVIQVSNSRGVEDRSKNAETIPVIDQTNIRSVLKKSIYSSSFTDVTGGMAAKVREAYVLAKRGVPTFVISPEEGNLYRALEGSMDIEGTLICFS